MRIMIRETKVMGRALRNNIRRFAKMDAATILVAAFLSVFGCASKNDHQVSSYTEEIVSRHYMECQDEASYLGSGIFCLAGSIGHKDLELVKRFIGEIHVVMINSSGGSAVDAIKIANYFNDASVDAVILDRCWSSCYNYIMPSIDELFILRGASIFGHGWVSGSQERVNRFCLENFEGDNRQQCLVGGLEAVNIQSEYLLNNEIARKLRAVYFDFYNFRATPEYCEKVRCDFRMYLNEENIEEYYDNVNWLSGVGSAIVDNCSELGEFVVTDWSVCYVQDK